MKIIYLLIITSLISFSEEKSKKKRIVEIRGFEENYYWNPNNESLQLTPVSETESNNKITHYEYTNFNGEVITRKINGSVGRSTSKQAISNINFANDPNKPYYSLFFKLNKSYNVKIELYDTDGNKVSDLFNKRFKPGSNQIIINKNYPKGVYLIHFIINGNVKKQRVLFH